MKRNWKVDNTALIGEFRFWHGEPSRLPAPWAHRCFYKHPWNQTVEGRCPAANQVRGNRFTDLCVIQKLDNLLYLEYKLDEKEKIK